MDFSTQKTIVGIDPGKDGALAWFETHSDYVQSFRFKGKAVRAIAEWLYTIWKKSVKDQRELHIFIEKVGVMRHDGRKSASTFGKGTGRLEGYCTMLQVLPGPKSVQLYHVPPATWQTELGCLTGGDKNITKMQAAELFPTQKVVHGNADALLIADYGCKIMGVGRYLNEGDN